MIAKRICIICSFSIAYLVLLTSCSQPSNLKVATPTSRVASPTPSPTIIGTATPDLTPVHFMTRTILSGRGRPDDLVFDPQGRLLFSDFYNGTISRINTDGSVTVMLKGIAGPNRDKFRLPRLRPGHYTAMLTARDAAGNRSNLVTFTFTITKPRKPK